MWLSGKASAITNSPYNAGMSETIFKNRSNERRYFNKLNNCLKIAVLADLDNNIIDMNNEIAYEVTETLIMLDILSTSSQKRQNYLMNLKILLFRLILTIKYYFNCLKRV